MRRPFFFACLALALPAAGHAAPDPFAHTYSIVARDPRTGELGVAVQSHWFQVGTLVPWAEAGVGAIATQALTNASYGPRGLALLRAGKSPAEVVRALAASDPRRENRQLIAVDAKGRVAGRTGKRCIQAAGHLLGQGFATAANLMRSPRVWKAMAHAFRQAKGPLAERLLASLHAGQRAGGDARGQQSAALLVVAARSSGKSFADRTIDLRVADHPQPLAELGRLLRIKRAYQAFSRAEAALERKDLAAATRHFQQARRLAPDVHELAFWHGLSLYRAGSTQRAIRILRDVFAVAPAFRETLRHLPSGKLISQTQVDEILARCARAGGAR